MFFVLDQKFLKAARIVILSEFGLLLYDGGPFALYI